MGDKFNSEHEAYAVLKQQLDELWAEVRGKHPERTERMRAKASDIAGTASRFVQEVGDVAAPR